MRTARRAGIGRRLERGAGSFTRWSEAAFLRGTVTSIAVHSGSLVTLWALGEQHFFLTIPHVMCATLTSILLAMV